MDSSFRAIEMGELRSVVSKHIEGNNLESKAADPSSGLVWLHLKLGGEPKGSLVLSSPGTLLLRV